MGKLFYITTTLPYVNSNPHVGFAMEIIRADVIARHKRLVGYDVFFNTGTDEHGAKIYENAVKEAVNVQTYVDGYAHKFKELTRILNIEDVQFLRTTDERHVRAAREMWRRCYENGYIYKKVYQTKYCVGCELNKTDSELENGKCPIHQNREIELIDEENYFFKFSEFQQPLLAFYKNHPDFVVPDFRYNEIKAFVERGLEDFSISRLKSNMPWGISLPQSACDSGDEEKHVMYVWFDALTSYISTLGWPDHKNFEKFWEQKEEKERNVIQYCGKDNLRQQSAMWQAMLMASGLPNSSQIIIDGFIISGGQKMSKSTGNVINPTDVIDMFRDFTDYPEEVLRFILLHEVPSFEDGDLTMESIKTVYTAYLSNGIGNLTSRIMKMATTSNVVVELVHSNVEDINSFLDVFDTKRAIEVVVNKVKALDKKIQTEEPFKVIKIDEEKGERIIKELLISLYEIANGLNIFLPKTSAKIIECISKNKMPEKPIFNRLS